MTRPPISTSSVGNRQVAFCGVRPERLFDDGGAVLRVFPRSIGFVRGDRSRRA
ncbi:hypothetical protein [Amycolatopsis australiensis]|uniref:Uncharacterized protein n=1 Tax=Amycolatopsis australiensis TaxID=546364 RepID=A0A1K1Q5Z2_9PSEU|nr:hypothetical protein [Amycolatopsis australiensis]SFW55311.1 hypothetical protein SAMN04489730_1401 [Amycolatopsis australiensis]